MITKSRNFNGCGNKIFLDCENDAYQSINSRNDYRITDVNYNEATGYLTITQNPDVTKITNIGDNSVSSNTYRSHLDSVEYILDYQKFKKSGTNKFETCKNYIVYNQYAESDKKYIYFTYSSNANRWYEISLVEGDEFYDKLTKTKYRYTNGRLVNIIDVKLTKSQARVEDKGTDITITASPSTSKGVVIPLVNEFNAGLMSADDKRRINSINNELVGFIKTVNLDETTAQIQLLNLNNEVIASTNIERDTNNFLYSVEAVNNGRRTIEFQMYDKNGPTNTYIIDIEDWFDYVGSETSTIKLEVSDKDIITANLKISSNSLNTLEVDNEGLLNIIKWQDGNPIGFKVGTEVDYDPVHFKDILYFASDTKNIILNGNKYGIDFNDNDLDLVTKIETTDTVGELKITNTNGEVYALSLPLCTEDSIGLMTPEDKKKLNTIANTSISQVTKVFRDGVQGLEITVQDIESSTIRTEFIPFSEVDYTNNGVMSIADKIKLDAIDINVTDIKPFELEDDQFGTRLVYTVRDFRDPDEPVDITKYQEIPYVQDTSAGLMPKEYKIKSDRIISYLQSVNTTLTKDQDSNTITFIEYNPNTDKSGEVLVVFGEVTETEAGLLGAIDKIKLNRIIDYLVSIEPETTKTETTQVININRFNPNTNETVVDTVTITEATDEHAGLITSTEHSKLEGITDYVNDLVDTSSTEGGRDINYTKYDSDLHEVTEHSILIPNATQTENGLQSSLDKIKEDNITTYPREFQDAVSDDQGVNIAYNEYQPSDATNVSSKINIKLATQTENGVMSSVDKVRVDNAPQDAYTDISLDITEDNYTIVTEQKDRDSGELTTTRLDLPLANMDNRGIIPKEMFSASQDNYLKPEFDQTITRDNITIISNTTKLWTNEDSEQELITIGSATTDQAGIISADDYLEFTRIPDTIINDIDDSFSNDEYNIIAHIRTITDGNDSEKIIEFPLVTHTNRGLISKEDKIKLDNVDNYTTNIDNFASSELGVSAKYYNYNPNTNETIETVISIPLADQTNNGIMSNFDKIRLDNIPKVVQSDVEYNFEEDKYQVIYTNINSENGDIITETIDFPIASDTNRGLLAKETNIALNKEYLTAIESENLEDKVKVTYTKNNILSNGQDNQVSIDINPVTQELSGVLEPSDKIKIDNIPLLQLNTREIKTNTNNVQIIDHNINISTGDSQDIVYTIPSATKATAGLLTPELYGKMIQIDVDGMVNTIDRIFVEGVEQKPNDLKDVYLDVYNKNSVDLKLKNLNDEAQSDIENLDKEINNRIDQEVADLNETINNLDAEVNDRIDREVETLNNRIDTEVDTLNTTIINTKNEINNRIDQEVETINNTISDLDKEINTRIDNEVSDLNDRIDQEVETINNTITNLDNELSQDITDLKNYTDATFIPLSQKAQPNGVATLNEVGEVPASQLPSYVDDVIEVYATYDKDEVGDISNVQLYSDAEHLNPITGEPGKIYVNVTPNEPNYNFRWSGTQFLYIDTGGLILGEITGTAYDGAKGKHTTDIVNSIPSGMISDLSRTPGSDSMDINVVKYIRGGDGTFTQDIPRTVNIPAATQSTAGVMTANDRKLANQLNKINKVSSITNNGITSDDTNLYLNYTDVNTSEGNTSATSTHKDTIPASTPTTAGVMTAKDRRVMDNLNLIGVVSHMNDENLFTSTSTGVTLNYECIYTDGTTKTEATVHNMNIPVVTQTTAGILTASDKVIIDNVEQDLADALTEAKEYTDGEITKVNTSITNLTNKHNTDISTINSTIDDLEAKHDSDISSLTSKHNSDVTTINNTIDALEDKHDQDVAEINTALDEIRDNITNVEGDYLKRSGGTMTGPIEISYDGILDPNNNRIIQSDGNNTWFGASNLGMRLVTEYSNILHRKDDVDYIIYDESNFVAGINYLAPGAVTIADISNLGSTWDSYLKSGVYDRNITVNGTSYPVMTDVSGATAINIYAPTAAGTSGQYLKSTGGAPSWTSDLNGQIGTPTNYFNSPISWLSSGSGAAYIVLTLPGKKTSNQMFSFDLRIYGGYQSTIINFTGYLYNSQATVYDFGAKSIINSRTNLKCYSGYNSNGNGVIVIQSNDGAFSYYGIAVENCMLSYREGSAWGVKANWGLSVQSSAPTLTSGSVSSTITLKKTTDYITLSGDTYKPNNSCWGGTTTSGQAYCLAFIDTNNYVDIGTVDLPLNLRGNGIMINGSQADLLTVQNFGSITFTGAATGTFNGTNDITVNIPQGGGEADSVAWANVTGKPSWIGSNKPTYTWSEISGKPSTFTPSTHTHSASDITSGTLALARIPTGITSSTVALGNHTHSQYLTSSSLSGYATQTWVNSQIDDITPASIGAASSSHTHSQYLTSISDASGSGTGYLLTDASGSTVYRRAMTSSDVTGALGFTPANSSHTHTFSDITFNNTGTNRQYLAGDGTFYTVGWSEIGSKPSSFTPSSHTHSASDITSGTLALARIPTGTTSSTVALGNHTHSNYLTSSSLSGYATESYVDDAVANVSIDTSGFVTISTTQTITGAKTFTNSAGVKSSYGFYDTSDIRLKSNIQDIELKDKINLYEFDKGDKHSYGVIAQEIEQIYPSVVQTDEDGYKTVNYNEVLSIKCAELEAENRELKSRLDKLEAILAAKGLLD